MPLVSYVTCKIEFRSSGRQGTDRDYSDRTLLELHQGDTNQYFLRAIDIQNNKEEIFNFQLNKQEKYKFGTTFNYRDEVRTNDGTYRLYLKQNARDQFHASLRTCYELLESIEQEPPSVTPKNKPSTESVNSKSVDEGNEFLTDIYKLGRSIASGNEDDAADLAKRLAKKGIRLHFEAVDRLPKENVFSVKVLIDGIDPKINEAKKEYRVDVYPSTKVHELRAIFEYACDFPSTDQYFFVNGHLGYAESTMKELKVEENSLFVLFVTGKYYQSHRF